MNDEIEQRIERLRPADPAPEFLQRLLAADPGPAGTASATRSRMVGARRAWWAVCAASAAALVAFAAVRFQQPDPPTEASGETHVFNPANSRSLLVRAEDMGVLAVDPDRPFRLVRCTWLDDEQFDRDDGNSSLRTIRAREQIIPVALPTY